MIPSDLKNVARAYLKQAREGLLTQNQKSLDCGDSCLYRSKGNSETLKCGIGFLITDEEYKPEMEGWDVQGLFTNNLMPKRFPYELQDFLMEIQSIHDDYSVGDWEEKFYQLENKYFNEKDSV